MGDDVTRAKAFARASENAPGSVDVAAVTRLLQRPSLPPEARERALDALRNLADAGIDIDTPVTSSIARLLRRDSQNPVPVLECAAAIAASQPELAAKLSDDVILHLSSTADETTTVATQCLVEIVLVAPDGLVDAIPKLATLLNCDDQAVRENAVFVLSKIGHANPSRVVPLVPRLVADIDSRSVAYRADALSTLGAVASKYPSAIEPATETIADIARSPDATIRGNAIGVLGDAAKTRPQLVMDHLDVIRDSLDSDDPHVRSNATSTLVTVASRHPGTAEGFIPDMIEVLDDPSPVVRQNACSMLGHVGATVAIPHLKARKQQDDVASVRKTADWALQRT
jgi:HEAT repeat protein